MLACVQVVDGRQIKLYSVIYKAVEEMKDAMEGLLSAKIEENVVGSAEIRETFKISKVGTIAGCFVIDGNIKRNNKVRVIAVVTNHVLRGDDLTLNNVICQRQQRRHENAVALLTFCSPFRAIGR